MAISTFLEEILRQAVCNSKAHRELVDVLNTGGGGVTDHALLTSNLAWTTSGHTGSINTLVGFDGSSAAVVHTYTEATALLDVFTDALKGLVPASGGGTVNFLRADGTFAAPPGGGTLDHAALTSNLAWTSSAHTGAINTVAGFDGAGAAIARTATQQTALLNTFTDALQGVVPLSGGGTANFLRADGSWATPPDTDTDTTDHTAFSNLAWTSSAHTGTAGSLASFSGAGAAAELTGAQGDLAVRGASVWGALSPGTSGQVLTSTGAGSEPTYQDASVPATADFTEVTAGQQTLTGIEVRTHDGGSPGTWNDRSADAASTSGSTFTFWDGITAGFVTYIGANEPIAALQAAIDATAHAIGSGTVVVEISTGPGTWTELRWMSAEDTDTSLSRAQALMEATAQTDVIRLGVLDGHSAESVTDMPGGSSLYWVRFRISVAITTAPVLESLIPWGHHTRIKGRRMEWAGDHRLTTQAEVHPRNLADRNGAVPGNLSFRPYSNLARLDYAGTGFADAGIDGLGDVYRLPDDGSVDTSVPIPLLLGMAQGASGSGNVEIEMLVATNPIDDADVAIAAATFTVTNVIVAVPGTIDQRFHVAHEIDICNALPGEITYWLLSRDASGGNGDDTYGNTVGFYQMDMRVTRWHT